MTTANFVLSDYANRVLGVIKERFALRDKSEALNKFAELCGEEFVDREVDEKLVSEIIDSCNAHVKKRGLRKMSLREFDALCELS